MDEEKNKKLQLKNKHLAVILSILGCIIIILITAIVIVNINSSSPQEEPQIAEEDEEDEEEDDELYWEGMSEEEFNEAQLHELEMNLHSQTLEILGKNPSNVAEVNKLYDSAIAKALELGRSDYVISFIDQRKEDLLSFGLTREALDAMLTTNFSLFSEPDQYRLYTEVIELAEELNDKTVLSEYKALQKSVEAAYQADYEATAEAAARSDDFDPWPGREDEEEE